MVSSISRQRMYISLHINILEIPIVLITLDIWKNLENKKCQVKKSELQNVLNNVFQTLDLENIASAWKVNFQTEKCYLHDMQNIDNNVFQEAVAEKKAMVWIKSNFSGWQKN